MFEIAELIKATRGRLRKKGSVTCVSGISIDSRTIKQGEAFIAIKGSNFDGHDFILEAIKKGASCIIALKIKLIPKDRRISLIEVNDTVRALGDIAMFCRSKFNLPVIAVTGSNGKTTVKDMIAWVLSGHLKVLKNEGTKNNQIGIPLTLVNLNRSFDLAVLEIGTNHFGEVAYLSKLCKPNIGIITNIGPAHLEFLQNLAGVFQEKYTLIKNLKKPRVAILNADDTFLKRETLKKSKNPFVLGVGEKNRSDFLATDIKVSARGLKFCLNQKYKFRLRTLGWYNVYNALIAIAVARLFGLSYKDIALRLENFSFPQGRLNFITLNEVRFIDDTYNSNPLSLKEALEVLANFKVRGRKIFVMGDMLELGTQQEMFHCALGRKIAQICDVFISVGNLSKLAAESARERGLERENIFTCDTPYQARDILFNKISPTRDDIVLVKGSRAMRMEEVLKELKKP